MKTVELFAGSKSFSRIAAIYGGETFAVDWKPYEGIDLVTDIGGLNLQTDLPYVPNIIWASPDCTTYSKAAGRIHRIKGTPVTDYAVKCDEVNSFFLGQIEKLLTVNPGLIYFIENPQGQFRKMPFILDFMRRTGGRMETVCYCQYGHPTMKPTDIFTSSQTWKPRPMCRNNNPDCHHLRNPSGAPQARVAVLGRSRRERSKIPHLLMFEIIESTLW